MSKLSPAIKTLIVLVPGGLLGAGVGALIGAFQAAQGSPAMVPLQVAGILLGLGSILLRVVLSEAGFSLSAHAGLISNGACTFSAGLVVIYALSVMGTGSAVEALAVVALAWIPCVLAAFAGLVVTAPWRAQREKRPAEGPREGRD